MRRTLTIIAVAAALLVVTTSAAPAARDEAADEREARGLAVKFMKRLRETNDFGPLAAEFFPSDFAGRLRAFVREQSPDDEAFTVCDREVLLRAADADLRRAYVALMNFWNQQDLLGDAALDHAKLENRLSDDGDAGRDWDQTWKRRGKIAAEAVPEEVFRIAESDPALKLMFELVGPGEESEGASAAGPGAQGGEVESEQDRARMRAASIRDLARLRAVVEKLERCVALLRPAIGKLRARTESLAASHGVPVQDPAAPARDEFKVYKLESETLESGAFGLPAGEVMTEARVYPFSMVFARLGGRLTMLAAYPDFDGD